MSSPVAIGEVLANKYRVERLLGQGGMGVVVEAWHLELEQRVAVKCLLSSLAERPEAAERFRREAKAVARIKSEHVIRVLDVGILDSGSPYMVMEYLEGQDLAHEIEERGPIPVTEAVDYLLQATEAMAEAHAAGVIHRDLTPGNLFLSRRSDGSILVKVLDFGISKVSGIDQMKLTRTSTMMGSPLYMSPEQMQAPHLVNERADIWSLGSILYHAMGGQPPHLADTLPELCVKVLETTPQPLAALNPAVPPELSAVVMTCLQRKPEARFESVSELAQALAPFGTATSMLHVERASRLIPTTSSGLSSSKTLALEPTMLPSAPPPRDSSSLVLPSATAPSAGTVETAASFGYTNTGASRQRRGALFAVAGGLVAVAVVLALFVPRWLGGAEALPTEPAQAPVPSSSAEATKAPTEEASEIPDSPETPSEENAALPDTDNESDRTSPADTAKPPAPPPPRVVAAPARTTPKPIAPVSSAPRRTGGTDADKPAVQISDFGGRR